MSSLRPFALRARAAAHRAMAVAALRADSALSVRLRCDNHHMTLARSLEAAAAQQQITVTSHTRTALACCQSGKLARIDMFNLREHLSHVRTLADLNSTASPDTAEG